MKKRILIVSQEFPPSRRGAGVVAAQYAISLARHGRIVTVFTVGRKERNGKR